MIPLADSALNVEAYVHTPEIIKSVSNNFLGYLCLQTQL